MLLAHAAKSDVGGMPVGRLAGLASSDSKFLPLGRIAWLEGGLNQAEGMRAAVQNALSCLQAGKQFVQFHGFTKKLRWYYDVEGSTTTVAHQWELRQRWLFSKGQNMLEAPGSKQSNRSTALRLPPTLINR